MKLAILGCRGIPARYGGFETFAEELSTRLVQRGIAVTVYCQSPDPRPAELYKGVELQFIPVPKLGSFEQLSWDARCLWHARSRFDVVYLLGYGASGLCWIPRLFGSEMWVNTDGIEWARTKWNWWQRLYVRISETVATLTATHLITDCAAVAAYFRRRYRRLPPISTIAYGAYPVAEKPSAEFLQAFGLKPDNYYLTVCRLEPENHVLEIIEAFEQARSDCELVIVGDHTVDNEYVRKLVAHSSDRVRFVGTIYNPDKLRAVRYFCRAYLHGHSVGGTNPSLLESMACANVVIAHDNPFNREVLGDSGLYFQNPAEAARHITAIDAARIDPNLLKAAAVDVISERYTWSGVADAYESLLLRECRDSRRRSTEVDGAPALAAPVLPETDEGSVPIAPDAVLSSRR